MGRKRFFKFGYVKAQEIRDLFATGGYSPQKLAEMYSVNQNTIFYALKFNIEHLESIEQVMSVSVTGATAIPDNPGFWVKENALFYTAWDMRPGTAWYERKLINPTSHFPVFKRFETYPSIQLYRTRMQVHRAVLLTFRGPCPEGEECLHLDDIPFNNYLSNLKYGTHLENMQMAKREYIPGPPNIT